MMTPSRSDPELFSIWPRLLVNSRRRSFRGSKYKYSASFFATVSRMAVLLGVLRHYKGWQGLTKRWLP